tara:strand:- start:1059 stop:1592 length:534 start_codon:yes stop_codon:yes gene_type:complete
MFYKDSNNNKYRIGTPFEYGGYYYAASQANHPKFMELGFTQVIVGSRPDSRFYTVVGPDLDGQFSSTPRELVGLKTSFINQEKQTSFQKLRETDWYVLRNIDGAGTVPTAVATYRSAIRTAAETRCNQINACTTVAELEELIKEPAQLYDPDTAVYSVNPDRMEPWPEIDTDVYHLY